jgi:hypothetical protein
LLKNLGLAAVLIIGTFFITESFSGNGVAAAKMIAPSKSSGAFAIGYSFFIACLVSLVIKLLMFRAESDLE